MYVTAARGRVSLSSSKAARRHEDPWKQGQGTCRVALLAGELAGGLGRGAGPPDADAHRLHQAPLPQQLQPLLEQVRLRAWGPCMHT